MDHRVGLFVSFDGQSFLIYRPEGKSSPENFQTGLLVKEIAVTFTFVVNNLIHFRV